MQAVGAFPAVLYICPECREANTLRIPFQEQRRLEGRCKKCRTVWTIQKLESAYGFSPFSRKMLNFLATEFICDNCGRNNVFTTKPFDRSIIQFHDNDPAESWKPPESREIFYVSQEVVIHTKMEGTCKFCCSTFRLLLPF